ncbi:Reverse transcriptase zinc-binding domain [Sesbania bispinosa]|nr:Reverse transcriptase zinc-binding domain [Sesbania bispinosa]
MFKREFLGTLVMGITLDSGWMPSSLAWDLSSSGLPSDIIAKIHVVPPPRDSLDNDTPLWAASADGNFQMKSVYAKLAPHHVPDIDLMLCNQVWKWKGTPRIQCFLWKCIHGKLPTKVERSNRGLLQDTLCCKCSDQEETIMHALRDCPAVMDL